MSDMLLPYILKLSSVPVTGRKLKYGIRNTPTTGSTTGLNKDMPLILNNNNPYGVTDAVRKIIWFYKQDKSKHIF